ncbi:MAG: tryptophan synthase subunit alpha [Pseudomonadota bacterium]
MSRIAATFARLAQEQRKALIPYITAGDPDRNVTVPLMHAMVEAGADIIELGFPFSDPMADGPVIQLAHERALKHNTSLRDSLAMVREFRTRDGRTPVVLMGYLNPIEALGYDRFVAEAVAAGVDGVLVVDLPPEESDALAGSLKAAGLDPIYLLAPTTTEARMRLVAAQASGYLYYVSLKGVTGASTLDVGDVARKVETIRNIARLPIGVGFGIKDADTAAAIARVSDGVVVGSALVRTIEQHASEPARILSGVPGLLREMRSAMDQNR